MKLNYAPQAGLRRRRPDHARERWAFWAGIGIVVAFELVLMSKSWSLLQAPLDGQVGAGADSSSLPPDSD
jgi:hypothetical protein